MPSFLNICKPFRVFSGLRHQVGNAKNRVLQAEGTSYVKTLRQEELGSSKEPNEDTYVFGT